jgi:hypothetical protein
MLDMRRYHMAAVLLALGLVLPVCGGEGACISGVPVGQRPGPYTFHVATGQERGQLTCYI